MLRTSTLHWVPLLVMAALAVGCHHAPVLDSAQATTDNAQKAKAAGVRPLAVKAFTSDGDRLPHPTRHLYDTLVAELQGAGLLDPASAAHIEGQLVSADLGKASGSVAARFIVVRAGQVVYDRELRATSTWRAGADVAREQEAVFHKLVGLLFTDPGFRNAVPR